MESVGETNPIMSSGKGQHAYNQHAKMVAVGARSPGRSVLRAYFDAAWHLLTLPDDPDRYRIHCQSRRSSLSLASAKADNQVFTQRERNSCSSESTYEKSTPTHSAERIQPLPGLHLLWGGLSNEQKYIK